MSKFAEPTAEAAALEWLAGLGYAVAAGPDLLDGPFAERPSATGVLLEKRLAKAIAPELVETVKKNVTIDWTIRDSVQANLRRLVKRILKKYGYPPDKQEHATTLVLQQAALHAEWAA